MSSYTAPVGDSPYQAAKFLEDPIPGVSGTLTVQDLAKLFATFGQSAPYTVPYTLTDTDYAVGLNAVTTVTTPDTVVVADDMAQTSQNIDNALSAGGTISTADATVINNTSGASVVITTPDFETKSVYIVVQNGAATVTGGTSHNFIVDASNDSSSVSLTASSADGSFSRLIGGSGSDTLTGSSGANSTSDLVAGEGSTTMIGGLGAVTMVAGLGENNYMDASKSVSGLLDDRNGDGSDTVIGGANDTIYGSTFAGSTITMGGHSSVLSAGSDTINVGQGAFSDTITAGTSNDAVHFSGYTAAQVQGLLTAALADPAAHTGSSVTINFSSLPGGAGQSATLNNYTHITFK